MACRIAEVSTSKYRTLWGISDNLLIQYFFQVSLSVRSERLLYTSLTHYPFFALLLVQGQQMLKPTTHGCGSTAKPYRTKEVAVPRAFVTKRGHHVYLTAPEDMVVGSKCTLIERELQERERLCREVVDTTKTTTRLNEKALGFDEKEQKVGRWSLMFLSA